MYDYESYEDDHNEEPIEYDYACPKCGKNDHVREYDDRSDHVPHPTGGGSTSFITEYLECEKCKHKFTHSYWG